MSDDSKLVKNIKETTAVIGATAGAVTGLVTLFTALAQTRDALKGNLKTAATVIGAGAIVSDMALWKF